MSHFITESTQIHHTGATLMPYRLPNGTWGWMLAESPSFFEGDSYLNGKCVIPRVNADSLEELLMPEDDDP